VLLGLATLNTIGLSGAVLQMFSHGIIAGLLFAVVGRMVYDRTHTRDFGDLEGMGLNKLMPFASVTFVIAGVASMGLPGFSGFVAELQVLMGAWKAFPTAAILAGVGIVIGVAYTLRAVQKAFYADCPPVSPSTEDEHGHGMGPITVPERIGAVMLIGTSLLIGLCPNLLLNWIEPCLKAPLFQRLLEKGGAL
jgi:NADH-quinone oxidoreductase subunit M